MKMGDFFCVVNRSLVVSCHVLLQQLHQFWTMLFNKILVYHGTLGLMLMRDVRDVGWASENCELKLVFRKSEVYPEEPGFLKEPLPLFVVMVRSENVRSSGNEFSSRCLNWLIALKTERKSFSRSASVMAVSFSI